MKQEQPSFNSSHSTPKNQQYIPIMEQLTYLKAILVCSWFFLGNVLLLIGGDDSVDLGIKANALQLLNQSSMTLSIDNNKGHAS
jgi:hypothetical protein